MPLVLVSPRRTLHSTWTVELRVSSLVLACRQDRERLMREVEAPLYADCSGHVTHTERIHPATSSGYSTR